MAQPTFQVIDTNPIPMASVGISSITNFSNFKANWHHFISAISRMGAEHLRGADENFQTMLFIHLIRTRDVKN